MCEIKQGKMVKNLPFFCYFFLQKNL